jgi:hypothetical protein
VIPRWVSSWDRFWENLGVVACGLCGVTFFGVIAAMVVVLNLSLLSSVFPLIPDPIAWISSSEPYRPNPFVAVPLAVILDLAVVYYGVGAHLERAYGPENERRAACRRRSP